MAIAYPPTKTNNRRITARCSCAYGGNPAKCGMCHGTGASSILRMSAPTFDNLPMPQNIRDGFTRLVNAYTGDTPASYFYNLAAEVYKPGMTLEWLASDVGLLPEVECRCNGANHDGCAGCIPHEMAAILDEVAAAEYRPNLEPMF